MTTFASPEAFTDDAVNRFVLRAAVRRLDAVAPGWRARLDPASLDMYDAERCVLGQLYGTYYAGVGALATSFSAEDLLVDAAFQAFFPVELWLAELDSVPEEATQ